MGGGEAQMTPCPFQQPPSDYESVCLKLVPSALSEWN